MKLVFDTRLIEDRFHHLRTVKHENILVASIHKDTDAICIGHRGQPIVDPCLFPRNGARAKDARAGEPIWILKGKAIGSDPAEGTACHRAVTAVLCDGVLTFDQRDQFLINRLCLRVGVGVLGDDDDQWWNLSRQDEAVYLLRQSGVEPSIWRTET